jgi:hypothetical protein
MVFIESPIFTADVLELLTDEAYSELQIFLTANPTAGDIIQNTGGLRKIRWNTKGRGKSGGTRIIYFYAVSAVQIRMLLIYRKGIKDDLNAKEKEVLRKLNRNW